MLRTATVACALLVACASAPGDFSALVENEGVAVVKVGAYVASRELTAPEEDAPDEELGNLLGRLIGPSGALPGPNLGSGFLISEDGYIVTNAHLVDGAPADAVIVRLADRRQFKARVVGTDPLSDIALLQIDGRGLPHVRFGDADALRPGQWVAAIGSPLGLEQSISAGIVSAVERTLPDESYLPFIQTDVAINPGNSGGPLFNLRGEVIGVNSMIYSATGGSVGLSFAIPIDVAMDVVKELRAHGKVTRGRIGLRLQDLSPELATALRVPPGGGALVVDVIGAGPAERAGLQTADVIVAFGGKPVTSHVELMRLVADTAPGRVVVARYVRDGKVAGARITVDEAPEARRTAPVMASLDPVGLLVEPLPRTRRERLGLDAGVLVRKAEGAAQRAGIEPGDIILSVNARPVATPHALHEDLRAAGKGAAVALLIQREGARSFIALRLPD